MNIIWFRKDLRLFDNPALYMGAKNSAILPIYILDPKSYIGAASQWWLHESLAALNHSLKGYLNFYVGDPIEIFENLSKHYPIQTIYWNRCYDPYEIKRDSEIKKQFSCQSFNGSLLWEPWQVKKQDGSSYKIFTPFYKKGCLAAEPPREPLPKIEPTQLIKDSKALSLNALKLLPKKSWYQNFKENWQPGEIGAQKKLSTFLESGLAHYKIGRDYPAKAFVSRLSPHLHWGEISIHSLWHLLQKMDPLDQNIAHFQSELAWREFAHYLLYHHPELPHQNLQKKFDPMQWDNNSTFLKAWQKGQTGYPFIDAAMRELWQTGYMHNRARMVVASFLIKNLNIDWRVGAEWFMDCLLDADLANNSASWQWVAGCGTDAAPYFRIFNPITQSEKFDPDGEYIRTFVPELKNLPSQYIHAPFLAPETTLQKAGILLGKTYPAPIIDLKESREKALERYHQL